MHPRTHIAGGSSLCNLQLSVSWESTPDAGGATWVRWSQISDNFVSHKVETGQFQMRFPISDSGFTGLLHKLQELESMERCLAHDKLQLAIELAVQVIRGGDS